MIRQCLHIREIGKALNGIQFHDLADPAVQIQNSFYSDPSSRNQLIIDVLHIQLEPGSHPGLNAGHFKILGKSDFSIHGIHCGVLPFRDVQGVIAQDPFHHDLILNDFMTVNDCITAYIQYPRHRFPGIRYIYFAFHQRLG